MTLNPYAKPFLPRDHKQKEAAPDETQHKEVQQQEEEQQQQPDACFPLAELPSELLAAVAAGLDTPHDLGHAARASTRLLAAVRDAGVRLALTPTQQYALNNPRNSARLDAMVACITKFYPGTTELHLPNLPLEVHHVQAVLAALPRLTSLDLSACKKLTPPLVSALSAAAQLQGRNSSSFSDDGSISSAADGASVRGANGGGSVSSAVTVLQGSSSCSSSIAGGRSASCDLHRGRSAQLLRMNLQRCYQLDAECLPALLALPLQCLALSHLELRFCPYDSISRGCASSLQTLALNNCSQLSASGLLALARGCSQLEHLFLGGCTFAAYDMEPVPAAEVDSSAAAAAAAAAAALARAPEAGNEQQQLPAQAPQQQQQPQSATALALHGAAGIVAMLAELPHLRVLEVTFLGVSRLPQLQGRFSGLACTRSSHATNADSSSRGGKPAVWDLCRPEDVRAALSARQAAGAHSNLAMALRCAANASGKGRTTPLHVAADAGDADRCAALLALGASPSARDGGGSVPLFLAAESGHAAAARQLLSSPGADARVSNTAGESPLYISALRGHAAVVGVLLEHLSAAGVPWQHASLYGDQWTPLMAAAVADRTDVAGRLLAAAGPSARALVAAANRYGQTVMHIAARKGSAALLALLVRHGGAEGAWVADSLGETPVDIARKNRHQDFFRFVVAAA